MKVAFFSNYLNHHQLPFCLEMDKLTEHNFVFVAFMPTPQFRLNLGYREMNNEYSFVLKAYESREKFTEAAMIATEFDLMIVGSAPEAITIKRIKQNLLTFRVSERLFKNSILQAFSPRGVINRVKNHTRYMFKRVYMLCASSYTPFDYALSGAYIGKTYKWGYFPKCIKYDAEKLWQNKKRHSILWVGRLIALKHPEKALEVAERLKKNHIPFELNIIGNGIMEEMLNQMIEDKNLKDVVHMKGNMSPDDVRRQMEKAEIFLFTSDYHEGWGAVLNEAMNSGCAVVASHAIGSVHFLINHRDNGIIYRNGSCNQLFEYTKWLLENPEECKNIGIKAYRSISEVWNAEIAAERILTLANDLLISGNSQRYKDGPCSYAGIVTNWWYR